jgi:DNA-binding NarL/FixJ family response regulator
MFLVIDRLSDDFQKALLLDLRPIPLRSATPHIFPELTDRERAVLDLIAQGHNHAAIAERLTLSPKTVSNHVSNNFSKLQVADRVQAIIRAELDTLRSQTRCEWIFSPGLYKQAQRCGLRRLAVRVHPHHP